MNEQEILEQRILFLEKENEELKIHLKKYTAPKRSKKYYENNKEELLKKNERKPYFA
jgi:hypothetical protein